MALTLEELADYIIPSAKATVQDETDGGKPQDYTIRAEMVADPAEKKLAVDVKIEGASGSPSAGCDLDPDDVIALMDETLSVDAYIQSKEFEEPVEKMVAMLMRRMYPSGHRLKMKLEWEKYSPQRVLKNTISTDLYAALRTFGMGKKKASSAPPEYTLSADPAYIADQDQLRQLCYHVWNKDPVIVLSGPTGSGKTQMAYYLCQQMAKTGVAGFTVDATTHIEIDEMFDSVDISANDGVTTQMGTLCTFARETKQMGVPGIVVINEFNAFKDETRRAFYPLFDPHNRRHIVQSAKGNLHLEPVDFEHITFIVTTNPTQIQYLTDDLKAFSNAEVRRMVFMDVPYERDTEQIEKILKSIIIHKESFKRLSEEDPELEKGINWTLATQLFQYLNTDDGLPIPYDVSYSTVANIIWMGTVMATNKKNPMPVNKTLAVALDSYLLVGIGDTAIKDAMRQRAANCGIRQ
jgi:MoxR-like ATPase